MLTQHCSNKDCKRNNMAIKAQKMIIGLLLLVSGIIMIQCLTGCTNKNVHKAHKTITTRDHKDNRDNKVRDLDQVMGSDDNVKSTNEELVEV
ncbi:MAG: hypothetical protein LBM05_02405 [Endomicrobium sp.]|jgi:hypothetical protein|nr:hypothetical protein [Endomicrobium sp.]